MAETQTTEQKKHLRVLESLRNALPRSYIKHRIILMVLFAVIVLGYVFLFSPRTIFVDTASGAKKSAGEITRGMVVEQQVTASGGTLKSLLIDFDTLYRQNRAEYVVEVLYADGTPMPDGSAGTPVQRVFNADKLATDEPFGVALPPLAVRDGDTFIVRIHSVDARAGNALGMVLQPTGNGVPATVQVEGAVRQLAGRLSIQMGYEKFSMATLAIAIALVAAVCVAILFWGDKLHRNVAVLAAIFGVVFALVTPVLDTPDEGQHAASAFLLAEAQLSAGGGEIPDSFEVVASNKDNTLVEQTMAGVPQSPERSHTPWGGGKFFLGFLPQAIGLWIGKLFRFDMAAYFYAGRICNALVYALLAMIAVKHAKRYRLYFAVLSLMPMALVIAGSYNPDALTYGLALVLGSYFTHMYFGQPKKIGWRQMLVYMALCALLVMNKYTLCLFCLLPLFIPAWRYQNKRTKWLMGLAVIAVCAVCALGVVMWQNSGSGDTSALTGNTNERGANMAEQAMWILQNPGTAVSVYSKTLLQNVGANLQELFKLGEFEFFMESIFILVYFAFLAVVAFSYTRYEHRPHRARANITVPLISRAMILLAIALSVLLTYVALHLTWTPVGAATIEGVQGRYFVPLFVLLPFLGQNISPLVPRDSYMRGQLNIQFVTTVMAAFTVLATLVQYY